jgi:N-acetylglutamate synthase-like GNAT family acetyltransferase
VSESRNQAALRAAAGGLLHRAAPLSEKGFYLEEFYGKGLLFALIPPAGQRLSDLDALAHALRDLVRNQTRCILIAAEEVLPRVLRRMGRIAPAQAPPIFDPARGLRTRPYPPDSAVTQIWRVLRAGRIVVAGARTPDPEDLTVFAQELASRLDVFKLVLLDRQGGLTDAEGERDSFVQMRQIAGLARRQRSKLRRVMLRAAKRALEDGVNSVNLAAPRNVYEELFSFIGTGTLFTKAAYGSVKSIALEDFEEAEAMIKRGQNEGLLLARSDEEIAQILPSCFGYRVADEHLAGICSLLTEPYHREHAGELTALYTLTRFQGEGVGAQLVREVLNEARERKLRYVFACTSEEHAARFFRRLKFRKVAPADVAAAKWRGYNRERIKRLSIFRIDLPGAGRAR